MCHISAESRPLPFGGAQSPSPEATSVKELRIPSSILDLQTVILIKTGRAESSHDFPDQASYNFGS
jgi:hypothetical protein